MNCYVKSVIIFTLMAAELKPVMIGMRYTFSVAPPPDFSPLLKKFYFSLSRHATLSYFMSHYKPPEITEQNGI